MMEDVGGDSSDFLGEFSKGIFHAHFLPEKIQVCPWSHLRKDEIKIDGQIAQRKVFCPEQLAWEAWQWEKQAFQGWICHIKHGDFHGDLLVYCRVAQFF